MGEEQKTSRLLSDDADVRRGQRAAIARFAFSALFAGLCAYSQQVTVALVLGMYALLSGVFLGLVFVPFIAAGFRRSLLSAGFAAYFRTTGDILMVAAMVHFTGGVDSPLLVGFALPVVLSSFSSSGHRGRYGALLATAATIGPELLVYSGIIAGVNVGGSDDATTLGRILVMPALLAIALLVLQTVTTSLYGYQLGARDSAERERRKAEAARKEVSKLADFSRRVNEATDFQELTEEFFGYLSGQYGLTRCVLFLIDQPTNTFRVSAGYMPDTEDQSALEKLAKDFAPPVSKEAGMLYRSAMRKRPLYLRTLPDPIPHPLDRLIVESFSMQSLLHIPLVVRGHTIGIVGVEPQRPLRPQELRAIARFCDQIAGGLHTSHLIQRLDAERERGERARLETEKLAEFARRINETQDLDKVLQEVFSYLKEAYSTQDIVLQLVDEHRKELRTVSSTTERSEADIRFIERLRVPLKEESGTLYKTYLRQKPFYQKPLRPGRTQRYPGELDRIIVETLGLSSFAQFPLLVREKTIGILWMNFGTQHKVRSEIESISRFCEQIAGAVSASHLLREVEFEKLRAEDARHESEQLAAISRRLNETDDLSQVTGEVFRILRTDFRLRSIVLLVADESNEALRCEDVLHRDPDAAEFWRNFRAPLAPETGTLYRTWTRQKPLWLSRIPKSAPGSVDESIQSVNKLEYILQLPLIVRGRTMGLVVADPGRRLRSSEVEDISRFTGQIAGAIRSAQHLRDINEARKLTEESRAETEILANLSRKANAARNLDEILDAVAEVTQERFGADSLFLLNVDRASNSFRIESYRLHGEHGKPEDLPEEMQDPPISPESGTSYRTYRSKRALHLDRVDPKWLAGSPLDLAFVKFWDVKWFAELPLISEGDVVGILTFSGPQHRRLGPEERGFCDRMAQQVAGAVRAVNLLKQTAEAREASERLANLSRRLNERPELEHILELVIENIEDEFGIDGTVLMLLDKEKGLLKSANTSYPESASPEMIRFAQEVSLPLDADSVLVRVLKRGRSFYQRRVLTGPSVPELDKELAQGMGLTGYFAVPLLVRGEGIGLLLLTKHGSEMNLTQAMRTQIERYCEQVAGGILVADLLRQTGEAREAAEESRTEAEVLAQLSRQANEARDFDHLLQSIASLLHDRSGADRLALYVPDVARKHLLLRSAFYQAKKLEHGELGQAAVQVPLNESGGTLAATFRRAKTLYVPRIRKSLLDKSPSDKAVQAAGKFGSFVQIPLQAEDSVIGILTYSVPLGRKLAAEDIRFGERMAAQVTGVVRTLEYVKQADEARAAAEEARGESDRLLGSILPASVADELKREGEVEPLYYDSVSVLFTDFVGFTQATQRLLPDELIRELDGCFSQFDAVVDRNRMEKLKTIGDAYMCAAGLPAINMTHALDACLTALEFRAFMLQMAEMKKALEHDFWQIRIGIHSGPVTAGVIGTKKFAYDIWGDTVNTASRMESSGVPGEINISSDTYDLVKDFFECEYRGKVSAKGKGELDMYFLKRIRPELSNDDDGMAPNPVFEMMRYEVENPPTQFDSGVNGATVQMQETLQSVGDREGW